MQTMRTNTNMNAHDQKIMIECMAETVQGPEKLRADVSS